jgi:hypothetical protein
MRWSSITTAGAALAAVAGLGIGGAALAQAKESTTTGTAQGYGQVGQAPADVRLRRIGRSHSNSQALHSVCRWFQLTACRTMGSSATPT